MISLHLTQLAHPIEGGTKPRAIDRLEQVVDRMQFERVDRVLIVGRAEDDRRAWPPERRGHFEAAASRHLNVEQHEIRRQLVDALDSLHAVFRIADDFDFRDGREQLMKPDAGGLFIVHDQRADGHGAILAKRRRGKLVV